MLVVFFVYGSGKNFLADNILMNSFGSIAIAVVLIVIWTLFIWWCIIVFRKNMNTRSTSWLLAGTVEETHNRIMTAMERTNYMDWSGTQTVTVEWKDDSFLIHSTKTQLGRAVGRKTRGPLVPYEGMAVLTLVKSGEESCWALLTGTYTFDLPALIDNLVIYAYDEEEEPDKVSSDESVPESIEETEIDELAPPE